MTARLRPTAAGSRALAFLAVAVLACTASPALGEDDLVTSAGAHTWQANRTVAQQYRPGLPDDAVNLQPVLPQDFDACSGAPVETKGRGSDPATDARNLTHGGDVSFEGHRAFVACGADSGNLRDDGFAIVDIKQPSQPEVVARFSCVASSSDIAVWGDLLFLAADTNNDTLLVPTGDTRRPQEYRAPVVGTGTPCNEDITGWTPGTPQPNFFRGVRVVSVADPRHPRLVASVQVPRHERLGQGPHNLTVVPDLGYVNAQGEPEPRVVVLIADPGAGPTWMIAAPLDRADAVDLVRDAAGAPRAWAGTSCHDIAVFLPRRLAACNKNLSFKTVLYDISASVVDAREVGKPLESPDQPKSTPFHNAHHSSAFSWDGNRLIVTPEALRPNPVCNQDSGEVSLGVYIYDISDLDNPGFVGHHERPPVVSGDICTAKQLNVVPLRSGRDVAAVSWFGGGTSLIDFTTRRLDDGSYEPAVEIARFLGEPGGSNRSWAWASHWYNGHVYVNNAYGCLAGTLCVGTATRGLDVLRTTFSDPVLTADFADAVRLERLTFALQECHGDLLEQPWAAHLTGCGDGS